MKELPKAFLDTIRRQLGSGFEAFIASLDQPPPVSLRLNPYKRIRDFDHCEKVPWATDAFYIPQRISFTLDPQFQSGCYYVQEASSMFLEKVLKAITTENRDVKVLDLCAAPGGKSTHMLSTLPGTALVVSNEVIASRNSVLQQNITKWGTCNAVVTQNEPADFSRLPGFFDIIVIDAPCSGEGLFRKQPGAVEEWSPSSVAHCAHRQTEIIDSVYDSLKEGGHLIYSTCTYEVSENEDQISRLIEKYHMQPVAISNVEEGISRTENGFRFYPHLVKGEGFFISVLKKTEGTNSIRSGKKNSDMKMSEPMSRFIFDSGNFNSFIKNDELFALPAEHAKDIHLLMENLYVRKAGIHIGKEKGKDIVPDHELAMSNHLHPQIARVELSLEDALKYLRCDTLQLQNVPTGWAVVTYGGFPLGWIKGIGSRINNYFPRSLRVLKT